jgi:hypothetical protein
MITDFASSAMTSATPFDPIEELARVALDKSRRSTKLLDREYPGQD